jgi:hypothetical protein
MIDGREIRKCEHCGSAFHPVREAQRFHSKECHDQFYMEERRRALATWRRGLYFFQRDATLDGLDDEPQLRRRTG